MIARRTDENLFVLLTGVPWDVYDRFTDALGEHRLRHTYDRGLFELRREVFGVSWKSYEATLRALGDFHVRHIYDQGHLLLMSPLKSHDWIKRLISRFVESMAYDQHIPIQSIGSTTITSRAAERGFEADESYYVRNEAKVRGKLEFEPDVDPPPDLILEVDVTTSSVDQLSLYAAMKVPEVWLHDGTSLTFLVLKRGKYQDSKRSLAFPFLEPSDIDQFIKQHADMDETSLTRQFVAWSRHCLTRWKRESGGERSSKSKPKGRKK